MRILHGSFAAVRRVAAPARVAAFLARLGQKFLRKRTRSLGAGGVLPILVVADALCTRFSTVSRGPDIDVADASAPNDAALPARPALDVLPARTLLAELLPAFPVDLAFSAEIIPFKAAVRKIPARFVRPERHPLLALLWSALHTLSDFKSAFSGF